MTHKFGSSAVSRQGDVAPRTGFFHFFNRQEVSVAGKHVVTIIEEAGPLEGAGVEMGPQDRRPHRGRSFCRDGGKDQSRCSLFPSPSLPEKTASSHIQD